jgi:hypothetical protein
MGGNAKRIALLQFNQEGHRSHLFPLQKVEDIMKTQRLSQIVVPALLVAIMISAAILALPGKGLLARHAGGPPADPGNGVPWNQPKPNDLQPFIARHAGGPPSDPGNGVPWNQPKPTV